jgi:hypothetical protein
MPCSGGDEVKYAVYNPHNKPEEELPIIFGFINGSFGRSDVVGVLLAQDGVGLGSHVSSHEEWAIRDLGILEGTRPDRHKQAFQKHYPDGYRMEWVEPTDERLAEPLRLNQEFAAKHIREI